MSRSNLWTVVLAAGDGTRLRHLSFNDDGVSVPKQFWHIDGGPSMLHWTLHRAALWSTPCRTVPIVASAHRRFWEPELAILPPKNIVVQPENRGTGPGILLPLLEILARDRDATVVFVPSDHHVDDEDVLAASVFDAAAAVDLNPGKVILLGMTPESADPELGYIVGEPATGTIRSVVRFVEKPPVAEARQLIDDGAVWNSFIFVARGLALLRLFAITEPDLVGIFLDTIGPGGWDADIFLSLYEKLPRRDFSRDVLEKRPDLLKLHVVPACGWSDLGTPPRVQAFRDAQAVRRQSLLLAHAS